MLGLYSLGIFLFRIIFFIKRKRINEKEGIYMDELKDVCNPVVEGLMEVYAKDTTSENLNKLVNEVVKGKFLIPAKMNENNQPAPLVIKNSDGGAFLGIYTSQEHLPKEQMAPGMLTMPYPVINNMALHINIEIGGIVINPFTHNILFKMPLLNRIEEVEKEKKENGGKRKIKLTEKQYAIFERVRFEHVFLPTKLFADKKVFVDSLSDRREEYIDELYEESYQQKRMYPYIEEDFSVMPMQISEELQVLRVDFPTRDMAVGCAIRAYIVWDVKDEKGRYFTIDMGKSDTHQLHEVDAENKKIDLGEAPVEGAELQTILDMINDETLTS